MPAKPTVAQLEICMRNSAEPDAPSPGDKLGLGPMEGQPVNGLRHPPEAGTSGWFIWAGGEIDESDEGFFAPHHVSHLASQRPDLIRYLALPPGWRFQIAPGHEDVWYDAGLLSFM